MRRTLRLLAVATLAAVCAVVHAAVDVSDVVGAGAGLGSSLALQGGALGSNQPLTSLSPLGDLPDGQLAVAAAAGSYSSYVVTDAGKVYASGGAWERLTGTLDVSTESYQQLAQVPLPPAVQIVSVAANDLAALAVASDGSVYSWGTDGRALGIPAASAPQGPTKVPGLDNVAQVSLGRVNGAAVTRTGILYTWGEGSTGILGTLEELDSEDRGPAVVGLHIDTGTTSAPLPAIRSVSVSTDHAIALAINGQVFTWGTVSNNQLGYSSISTLCTTLQCRPRRVLSGQLDATLITMVAAGEHSSFALNADGVLYGWGIGDEVGVPSPGFTPALVLNNIVAVSSRGGASIAVDAAWQVHSWGDSLFNIGASSSIPKVISEEGSPPLEIGVSWESAVGQRSSAGIAARTLPHAVLAVSRCAGSPCGAHGICTGLNMCQCDLGWSGPTCQTQIFLILVGLSAGLLAIAGGVGYIVLQLGHAKARVLRSRHERVLFGGAEASMRMQRQRKRDKLVARLSRAASRTSIAAESTTAAAGAPKLYVSSALTDARRSSSATAKTHRRKASGSGGRRKHRHSATPASAELADGGGGGGGGGAATGDGSRRSHGKRSSSRTSTSASHRRRSASSRGVRASTRSAGSRGSGSASTRSASEASSRGRRDWRAEQVRSGVSVASSLTDLELSAPPMLLAERVPAPSANVLATDWRKLLLKSPKIPYALLLMSEARDMEQVGRDLVYVYESDGSTLDLIRYLVRQEVLGHLDDFKDMFRSTAPVNKLLTVHARVIGIQYAVDLLRGPMKQVLGLRNRTSAVEVDPAYQEEGTIDTANVETVMEAATILLSVITRSAEQMPPTMAAVCHTIRTTVAKKHGADAALRFVGSFVFLRFFNPAIADPERYALTDSAPTQEQLRLLLLVVKAVQTVVTDSKFGAKERFMKDLSPLGEKFRDKIIDFLTSVSRRPADASKLTAVEIPVDVLEDSLMNLYEQAYAAGAVMSQHIAKLDAKLASQLDFVLKTVGAP